RLVGAAVIDIEDLVARALRQRRPDLGDQRQDVVGLVLDRNDHAQDDFIRSARSGGEGRQYRWIGQAGRTFGFETGAWPGGPRRGLGWAPPWGRNVHGTKAKPEPPMTGPAPAAFDRAQGSGWIAIAGLLGAVSVLGGAFAAHGLDPERDAKAIGWLHTASL